MKEDCEIEHIWEKLDKPKRIDSGRKGNRGEQGVIELLTVRFGVQFSRIPDSGARASQVHLPDNLKKAYVGDILVPIDNFKFCIECKNGYDDIDIESILLKGKSNAQLDKFFAQAQKDADRVNKNPMLIWKKTRKPYLAFTKSIKTGSYGLFYQDWIGVHLTELLKLPDEAFME